MSSDRLQCGNFSDSRPQGKALISLIAIALMTLIALIVMLRAGDYKVSEIVISNDIISYYNYLPAFLKYHTIHVEEVGTRVGYMTAPDGTVAEKMSMGLAFLYLPFYLIAWLYVSITGAPYQEYSTPFSLLLNLSAIFYFFWGMVFLRKVLLRYFSDLVAALGMIVIFAGTNLLFYTVWQGPMSHVYNFFLISLFIWINIRWHERPGWGISILFGLLAGLIVLIRPSNATVLLLAVFWNVHERSALRAKIAMLRQVWPRLLAVAAMAVLVWVPQMIYWKLVTGHWLYFSYQGEGFFFNRPQIWMGLFSYRNGWLLYAPVMIFSLIGFFFLRRSLKPFLVPLLIYFPLSLYIIYSWWCWWYVGFGSRPLIDLYPALAVPLCAFIAWTLKARLYLRIPVLAVMLVLTATSTFKNVQYRNGVIHFDAMTGRAYWKSFFWTRVDDWNYYRLLNHPDYDAAKQGIYRSKN